VDLQTKSPFFGRDDAIDRSQKLILAEETPQLYLSNPRENTGRS